MTAKDKETCYHALHRLSTVAYAEASQHEVDTHNVYQASLIAASRAVIGVLQQLSQPAHIYVLLDGRGVLPEAYQPTNHPNCLSFSQQAIVKGDGCSFSIAAGSVIAKHQRDELILSWAANEPRYGWATNMGYPTPAHKQALLTHGPTVYHRQSVQIVQAASKQLTLTP
jgi:ribonuclease HII